MVVRTADGYTYTVTELPDRRFRVAHHRGSWIECVAIRIKVGEPLWAGAPLVAGGRAIPMAGAEDWETNAVVVEIAAG